PLFIIYSCFIHSYFSLKYAFVIFLTEPRSQFTRYRSWNSRMYPAWKDGDPRFRNCWSGGEVTFDLKNDAPTLTGARATFTINLNFPPNQTVLPDGQVVWERNCTINGQQYQEGQAVYPDQDSEQTGLFPDGTPFPRSQSKKPHYVFVWKTWGRYWQVADGPSSFLTIGTDNVPLGSYNMEVVIYHTRGKDKFIPLGYASSTFIITDQVPFTISLAQVSDVNQDDQNFIQNRAIAFSVKLHDPSQYLNNADISFSWDFGDSTGTLISREQTVTHTYLALGTFKPQVVLMASIPNGCGNPTAEAAVEVTDGVTVAPVAEEAVEQEADVVTTVAAADAEVVQAAAEAIADNVVAPAATETTAVEEAAPAEAEVLETENEVAATAAAQPAGEEEAAAPAEGEVQAEVEADTAQVALVVAKRQAPELTADCMVYRYGSIATSLDVVRNLIYALIIGLSATTSLIPNYPSFSLPSEVCTVISDADCITPVETICNAASPSPDCQLILRQFFNDSGVFCINVSLTNDVSLAVASARVSVTVGERFKQYQPLREDHGDSNGGSSAVTSVPLLLWNLLSRQSPGESRPLLQGRIV
uniref:Premelanosome protein a n=1 Tax=Seriola dumerili TaxID=41447 RepID=A0A3B4TIB7_SERDU